MYTLPTPSWSARACLGTASPRDVNVEYLVAAARFLAVFLGDAFDLQLVDIDAPEAFGNVVVALDVGGRRPVVGLVAAILQIVQRLFFAPLARGGRRSQRGGGVHRPCQKSDAGPRSEFDAGKRGRRGHGHRRGGGHVLVPTQITTCLTKSCI